MSRGQRILCHISGLVCGRLYFGVHFVVNPAAHVSQRAGWLWQQPTTVKVHDTLDLTGECVAIANDGNVQRVPYLLSYFCGSTTVFNPQPPSFFTQGEPCQKGWAGFALGIPLGLSKFGNSAHCVTMYSPYSGDTVYMHTFTPAGYGKFAWFPVAKSCPSFPKLHITKYLFQ